MTTERTTPAERYAASPRPLHFIRIRLYRGGQAEAVRDILRDEQESLYDDLGKLRAKGKAEDDPEVMDVRTTLGHLIGALKDIDMGLIELAGPDADPR